ncbi:hypothetical protein K456DRAFT_1556379 [Colletotrichum gloeosporioides 23]|nr:hypothetical protein K456DRAFT_1556379 [Colletotrichum gloeosporioides 23]
MQKLCAVKRNFFLRLSAIGEGRQVSSLRQKKPRNESRPLTSVVSSPCPVRRRRESHHSVFPSGMYGEDGHILTQGIASCPPELFRPLIISELSPRELVAKHPAGSLSASFPIVRRQSTFPTVCHQRHQDRAGSNLLPRNVMDSTILGNGQYTTISWRMISIPSCVAGIANSPLKACQSRQRAFLLLHNEIRHRPGASCFSHFPRELFRSKQSNF